MKSFDVTLEARVTLIACDEWDAIQKATSICGGSVLLMPMYVTEGYVRVWEPKKAKRMPANCTQPKPQEDVDAIMNIYNKVKAEQAQQPPKTDDEVPF